MDPVRTRAWCWHMVWALPMACCCRNMSSISPNPAWPLLRLTTGTPASPTASLVSSSACARTARTLRRRVTICVSTTASTLPGWVSGGPAWERYTCCKRRRTASIFNFQEDDVVSVELRAIAGATYPLVDKSYTPDAAAAKVTDGLTDSATTYQSTFPYLGTPLSGYATAPLAAA